MPPPPDIRCDHIEVWRLPRARGSMATATEAAQRRWTTPLWARAGLREILAYTSADNLRSQG